MKNTSTLCPHLFRHVFQHVASLTKPDQSGWLGRSLFQQAWSE